MTDRGTPPMDHPAFNSLHVAGLQPFACSYSKGGKPYGITLYGTDPESVLENNCAELEDLKVDGTLEASIPADNATAWRMIDAYGKTLKKGK